MYLTENESLTFFDDRLHADGWANSASSDRVKAIKQAGTLLDALNWVGYRAAAQTERDAQIAAGGSVTDEAAVFTAGQTQTHEFPRGTDSTIPQNLKDACALIAYELLVEGVSVNDEFAILGVDSEGHSSIRVNYQRDRVAPHLAAGIPSFEAWRLVRPFLRDSGEINILRVS